MKICRFNDGRFGLIEGSSVIDVSDATRVLPSVRWPVPHGDLAIRHLDELRTEIAGVKDSAQRLDIDKVQFLSPIPNPSKVIAAPLNYVSHVKEAGADQKIHHNTHGTAFDGFDTPIDKYGLFLKANTSVVGAGEGVTIAFPDRRNDPEMELAIIIGDDCRNIPESEAMSKVAGYCLGLDMSVRGTEDRSFRKSLDSFTVLGPWLTTADEIDDPGDLDFWLKLNGEEKQASNTQHLTVGIARLISLASRWYTLYPGDIILTGTPKGVSPVVSGDRIDAWIDGLGEMSVLVQ